MSTLQDIISFWSAAGFFVIPLLMLSVISWFWLCNLYFKLQLSYFRTSMYESEITHRLVEGQSRSEICSWLSSQAGIVPRIVSYVFSGSHEREDIRSRYFEASDSEINAIHKEFGLLDAMVKAAPLLGLLGTVAGMIQTFSGMGSSGSMATITAGISKALLTTQLGLLISLPGIFGLVFLKRRFRRFALELERLQFHIHALGKEEAPA
jgi:biopolymer transport protein ExbB